MTTYMKLTADTITDREIRALCREATQAGDLKMADIASRALDPCEDIIDPNEVTALRQLCADEINNARAQTAETRAAIESLRSFAVSHGELPFAHLCTSALGGEEWAIERIVEACRLIAMRTASLNAHVAALCLQAAAIHRHHFRADPSGLTLEIIRSTDVIRPDRAVARHMEAP